MRRINQVNNHQILPMPSEQQEELIIQPQQITNRKVFKIQNKEYTYTYDGPQNKTVDELLVILKQMETEDQKIQNQQHGRVIRMLNNFSQKILFEFTFFNERIKFDVNQLIITIAYWGVFIRMLFESIVLLYLQLKNLKNEEIVKNNENIEKLVNIMPLIIFLYTFGCLITSHFNNKLMWFILFIILFITPLFFLLDYFQNYMDNSQQSQEQIGITFCLLSLLIFFKSLFNQILKKNMATTRFKLSYPMINCSIYLLSTYYIYFQSMKLLVTRELDQEYSILKYILSEIKIPIFILQMLSTAIFILDLFRLNATQVFLDLKQISSEQPFELQVGELTKFYNKLKIFFENKLKNLERYSPFFVAIYFFPLSAYVYYCLYKELDSFENNVDLVTSYLFVFIAIPLFLLVGTLILNTNFIDNDKKYFLYIPLISNLLSVISLDASNIMLDDQQFKFISLLFKLHQPSFFVFWMSIGIFRSHQRIKKLSVIIYQIYFCTLPFFLLLTISEMQNNAELRKASFNLIYVGLIPIGLLLFLFISIIQALVINFITFTKLFLSYTIIGEFIANEFKRISLWLNSASQIVLFYMMYYLINLQNMTQTYKGMVIGFQIINFLFFILTYKYIKDIQINEEITLQSLKQLVIMKRLIGFGSTLTFIVFLLIYFLITNQTIKFIALFLAFGIPSVFQYFKLLMTMKTITIRVKFSLQLIITSFFQLFRLFFVTFILLINISDSSDDIQYYGQTLIKYSIFAFILVAGNIAIHYLNIHKNRNKFFQVQKQLYEYLFNKNVILSKKVVKRIQLSYIKNKDLEQIKALFENDEDIAMLQYKRTDQQVYYYVFISLIKYDWKSTIQIGGQNKGFLQQILAFLEKCICIDLQDVSFERKTRKELQRINLEKYDEETIIQQIHKKEGEKFQPKILTGIQSNQNKFCKVCKLISCESCENYLKFDNYKYANQCNFFNPQTIIVILNFKQSANYNWISKLIIKFYKETNQNNPTEKVYEKFPLTFTNIFTLIMRLYDYFSLVSIAFDPFVEKQDSTLYRFVDFSFIHVDFLFKFYFSLIITFLHLVLGVIAIKQIKNQVYGLENNGQIATYKNSRYWLSKVITVLNLLCNFVTNVFLKSFICDFSTQPYSLVAQPNVICMSNTHINYVIISIVLLLMYFPLTTFLQPILQYEDNSTNLRFDPIYVAYYIQAKLIIIGITVVSSKIRAQPYVYILDSVFFEFLAYFCYKKNPCKIYNYNFLESFLMFQFAIVLCQFNQIFYGAATQLFYPENKNAGLYIILPLEGISVIIYLSCFMNRRRVQNDNI